MIEEYGNIWDFDEYKLITTNGMINTKREAIMGAGIALQAKMKFPKLPGKLGEYISTSGNIPYIFPEYKVISFPTKFSWKNKSSIELIQKSAERIVRLVDKHQIQKIISCRPGCQNGGLLWSQVKPVIAPIFDDRFTILCYKNAKEYEAIIDVWEGAAA